MPVAIDRYPRIEDSASRTKNFIIASMPNSESTTYERTARSVFPCLRSMEQARDCSSALRLSSHPFDTEFRKHNIRAYRSIGFSMPSQHGASSGLLGLVLLVLSPQEHIPWYGIVRPRFACPHIPLIPNSESTTYERTARSVFPCLRSMEQARDCSSALRLSSHPFDTEFRMHNIRAYRSIGFSMPSQHGASSCCSARKNPADFSAGLCFLREPAGIRTPNLRIRSAVLYPVKLQVLRKGPQK